MLRLVLLLLSFAGSFWTSIYSKTGGGWDPDGLAQAPPPTGDWGAGLDPDG